MFRVVVLFSIAIIFLVSCDSGNKNKVKGLWKVVDVDAQFDEAKVNPQTLQQVIDLEKQTMLLFENDSVMKVIIGKDTVSAYYKFDKTTEKVSYRFDNSKIELTELGKYEKGKIIAETVTPLGSIKVSYQKSK